MLADDGVGRQGLHLHVFLPSEVMLTLNADVFGAYILHSESQDPAHISSGLFWNDRDRAPPPYSINYNVGYFSHQYCSARSG